MKNMKKIFLITLVLFCTISVHAADRARVVDYAGIFTEKQIEDLSRRADELSETHGTDFLILTTDRDLNSRELYDWATDFLKSNAYGAGENGDAVFFAISSFNAENPTRCAGSTISENERKCYTNKNFRGILTNIETKMKKGKFYDASKQVIKLMDGMYKNGKVYVIYWWLAIGLGIAALLVVEFIEYINYWHSSAEIEFKTYHYNTYTGRMFEPYRFKFCFPPVPFEDRSIANCCVNVDLIPCVEIEISRKGLDGNKKQESFLSEFIQMTVTKKLWAMSRASLDKDEKKSYRDFKCDATWECTSALQEKLKEFGFKVLSMKVNITISDEDRAMLEERKKQAEVFEEMKADPEAFFNRMQEKARKSSPSPAPQSGKKFCPNCGNPVSGGKFCAKCGSPV